MAGGTRSSADTVQVWLERVVFAGFAASIAGEAWALRKKPKRRFGDLDDATPEQLSDRSLPADPLVPAGFEVRDTAASLAALAGSLAFNRLVWFPIYAKTDGLAYRHRVTDVGKLGKGVIGFAGAMVLWDFLYYWEHRWMHRVRLLWAHHVTHHSSERYNLSTALRQPWSGILTHWVFLPMPLLGIPAAMHQKAAELNLLYQYWIHTEAVDRLRPGLEKFLNTPSHHRVHHGANPQYIDKNYGGILIVWDKLFGTFEPEVRTVKYGLTKNIKTYNPIKIGYHEFVDIARDVRRAKSWRDRLGYVFRGPGWAYARREQEFTLAA
jgi:sterol desaturase/sphingolipid hydroxylase (fatty acid hydroxylase superfamily)